MVRKVVAVPLRVEAHLAVEVTAAGKVEQRKREARLWPDLQREDPQRAESLASGQLSTVLGFWPGFLRFDEAAFGFFLTGFQVRSRLYRRRSQRPTPDWKELAEIDRVATILKITELTMIVNRTVQRLNKSTVAF